MKKNYLNPPNTFLRRLLGLLLLGLLLPVVLRAQSVTVQVAPGNTLPLQSFVTTPVNRTSALQSFMVSGDNLTGDVTVAAPEGFELRTGTNAFSTTSLTLSRGSGTLSATAVDVRFAPVASAIRPDGTGAYTALVLVSTPGVASTDSPTVAVAGTAVVLSALPVELSAFTAKAEGTAAVLLAWVTASELRNDHFDVERSSNGNAFTAVGTVGGAGTSSRSHTYSFRDTQLPAGATILYYRLRQVDTNGQNTYSPPRYVQLNGAALTPQLQAYPNPAHGVVSVCVLGPLPTAPLQLFDAVGRLVRTQPVANAGADTPLSLQDLPAGLYILRCGALSQRLTVH